MSPTPKLVCGWLLLLLVTLVSWAAAPSGALAADPDAGSVRRFALFVGANDGGAERETLLYAHSDAETLAKAMTDLGGLDKRDRVLLVDPAVAELEQGFADVAREIRKAQKAGDRVQFIFYYSGHSDETGLLLGGVHVDYKRLRQLIDKVPADVRIGILDSCSSGAFTRFKGGKKRAPFLVGAAAEVEGHAYLSSSSADEAAQESDRIGGSFFTHYLVTGLRGAADFDGDRRVTLNEAYRFAFDETLARTETTAGGPQHAAYEIKLAGTGDLVMTDLRKTSAKLEIAAGVVGRIYVRDRRGRLAAELFKPKDAGALTLALEPGNYSVTIDDGHELHRADVEVRSNKTEDLTLGGLEEVAIEGTRLRGDAVDRPERGSPDDLQQVPFNIGLAPGAELNTMWGKRKLSNNVSVSLVATGVAQVVGVQAAIGAVWTTDETRGLQAAVGAAISRGSVRGIQTAVGASLAREDFVGVQAGAAAMTFGELRGLQLGYGFSYAERLRGVQVGGANIAEEVEGAQLGLVNITRGRAKGVQVGLINYADEADASIALLPISKKHGVWLDLWTSDVHLIHGAVRFRARRTYAFLTGGVHPIGSDERRSWSAGFGFGGPLVWRRHFALELDNAISGVNAGFVVSGAPHILDTLRLSVSWRPFRHLAIWGAVTGNLLVSVEPGTGDFRPGYAWATRLTDPAAIGVGLQIWPGFALGFEF